MMRSMATPWQLILADLALILFLVTAAGLSADEPATKAGEELAIAPAQALYRRTPGGPSLGEWLAAQPHDPRAALTIVAEHRPDDAAAIWARAQSLADEARAQGVRVRTIIRPGSEPGIHASLAYDQPQD
jgi:hypothetical protein